MAFFGWAKKIYRKTSKLLLYVRLNKTLTIFIKPFVVNNLLIKQEV